MAQHEAGNLIDFDDDDGFPAASNTTTPPADPPQPHTDPTSRSSPRPDPPRRSQKSPPPPLSPSTTSSSGYGIGSAVWGLLRRISTVDTPPTPPPGVSQLYNSSANGVGMIPGAGGDGINGAFTPPRRTATPRGLPSLDPINLYGYRADTEPDERLLARGVAEEIRTFLPERLKIMEDWRLVYSLYQNGSSLATLYQLCEKYRGVRAGFVLVVRDGTDGVGFLFFLSFSLHILRCIPWRKLVCILSLSAYFVVPRCSYVRSFLPPRESQLESSMP